MGPMGSFQDFLRLNGSFWSGSWLNARTRKVQKRERFRSLEAAGQIGHVARSLLEFGHGFCDRVPLRPVFRGSQKEPCWLTCVSLGEHRKEERVAHTH